MVLKIYSVYDVKVQSYSTPFFAINDSVALRSFVQLRLDPSTTVHNFPDDFRLYCLGEFSDTGGALCPLDSPALIDSGVL
jgi:hypothetical protein